MRNSKFQVSSSKRLARSVKYRILRSRDVARGSMFEISGFELHDGPSNKPYDLEERTALFGEDIVRFARKVPRVSGNARLVHQLVGAGTSVGANYAEASETVSNKDFKYAISRCVKEAKETLFFLRMIAAAEPTLADEARELYRECRQLHLIFASMFRKK